MSAPPALAATFTVSSLADSGPGTLRQAVLSANSAAAADEVVFTVTGTITLTSGEIPVTDSLLVNGPGAGAVTVSGNDLSRIFFVQSPVAGAIDVTLSGLTLTRGRSFFGGGAVVGVGENLTILDSVISDSRAGLDMDPPSSGCGGNAAVEGGSLRIVNSLVTGGTTVSVGSSFGGNLCIVEGSLILERSTVSGGSSDDGGGIFFNNATATIVGSTISGNDADFSGGGIHLASGQLLFLNSTVSGNSAGLFGGGIYTINPDSFVTLRLSTVSNNTAQEAGGNLRSDGGNPAFTLDHAIVANGTPEDINIFSGSYTASYSLIETPATLPASGSNNLLGVDPLLGPLANNGGPTLTHLPLPGSPVIDAGNPAITDPPATDQRGFPRIAGAAVDLGSVEVAAFSADIPTLSQWSLILLSGLLLAVGVWRLRAV